MEVFCGFLDPLGCLHENEAIINSEASFYDYISKNQIWKDYFSNLRCGIF